MGWRTVIVDSRCKLSYKNGYLLLKKENDVLFHLSEIDLLVIATTQVSFTCVALAELVKNKVKIIFCDEKHNPMGEFSAFYGAHNTSKKINNQILWSKKAKGETFAEIVKQKILNQAKVLYGKKRYETAEKLVEFSNQVEFGDLTNREGHSAKIYFSSLFGGEFSRNSPNPINAALDYGYTILLSYINREIVSCGYITQVGINHCNEFNQFNLSCDFIEPFRPVVDEMVSTEPPDGFLTKEYKYRLIGLLSKKVEFYGKETYLSNAISTSVKSALDCLDDEDISKLKLFKL